MSENSPPEPGNTTINLEQLQSLINAQAQVFHTRPSILSSYNHINAQFHVTI